LNFIKLLEFYLKYLKEINDKINEIVAINILSSKLMAPHKIYNMNNKGVCLVYEDINKCIIDFVYIEPKYRNTKESYKFIKSVLRDLNSCKKKVFAITLKNNTDKILEKYGYTFIGKVYQKEVK
jgi:16S rRNA G966 N2-methylase RsmD